MKERVNLIMEPEFHKCLKEIARQNHTSMSNWVCDVILDTIMKDKDGKITDGESWIHDYKMTKKKGYRYALCDNSSRTGMSNM